MKSTSYGSVLGTFIYKKLVKVSIFFFSNIKISTF